ncbi:MAG TPA: TlpA disulfide reductase family protein [Bryobacteraceae bacterium]|jgi:thiol-disulfide isomerase/thioredoxin|nr:TlpA disulfide reductase family protein [Bryobacteraceae bacterium]
MPFRLLAASLLAAAAWADVVTDVRAALAKSNFPLAVSLVQNYRAQKGVTSELIEAVSWLGRGSLAAKNLDQAEAYAKEAQNLALGELKRRPLDAEPHLPLALGAAIEVQAQIMNERGERAEAVAFLRKELARYRSTSMRARLQKNINLLSLEGKVAPALDEHEFLGSKPVPLSALKGSPVLVFFWAHWCPDCKQEVAILTQIEKEYASNHLMIVAPTQRYGYTARGEEASPADELKYIDEVRHKFYHDLLDIPAPVSEENFKNYGASTTPTLVLIDRQGIVRLYHPGAMTLEELRAAINRLG